MPDKDGNPLASDYGSYTKMVQFRRKKYDSKPQRDANGQLTGENVYTWNGKVEDDVIEVTENHANQVVRRNSEYVEVNVPAKLGTKKKPKARGPNKTKGSGGVVEVGGEAQANGTTLEGKFSDASPGFTIIGTD